MKTYNLSYWEIKGKAPIKRGQLWNLRMTVASLAIRFGVWVMPIKEVLHQDNLDFS